MTRRESWKLRYHNFGFRLLYPSQVLQLLHLERQPARCVPFVSIVLCSSSRTPGLLASCRAFCHCFKGTVLPLRSASTRSAAPPAPAFLKWSYIITSKHIFIFKAKPTNILSLLNFEPTNEWNNTFLKVQMRPIFYLSSIFNHPINKGERNNRILYVKFRVIHLI